MAAAQSSLIMSAAFSPIIIIGALVLPVTMVGMMEPSTTRSPDTARTLQILKEKRVSKHGSFTTYLPNQLDKEWNLMHVVNKYFNKDKLVSCEVRTNDRGCIILK